MGLFGTKKDDNPATATAEVPDGEALHAPTPRLRAAELPALPGARVGIDHAIQLMRSLPTERNVELVVTVLKATLESLGIRVADIVSDAVQREKDLETRSTHLKLEIEGLEREIAQRADEIVRLEAARVETAKVRDYLEAEELQLVPVPESKA